MPQITYIDTDPQSRERESRQTISSKSLHRWNSLTRRIIRARLGILTAMALYRFVGLGYGEMQQWGESIYALRAQVILRFGALWDQSAYMLSGADYSAHPPLFVWLSTSVLLLFGDQLWAYRLISALAGALMVPLLYRLSRQLQSPLKSLVVTGLFAFAPLPLLLSRHGQPETLLALSMTAALYFSLLALRDGRAVNIFLAGCMLGAALLTRLLLPLSIPAALLLSALFFVGPQRKRALRTGLLTTLISLPFWLPWAWSFAAAHNGGIGFLFTAAPPFAIGSAAGPSSVTGSMTIFLVNQFAIHGSILLPFALLSVWRSLRYPLHAGWNVTALLLLLLSVTLYTGDARNELFVLPLLPLIFLHGIRGLTMLRRASRPLLLSLSLLAAICFAWSLSPSWRAALPDLLHSLTGPAVAWDTVVAGILFFATVIAALLLIWLLIQRNQLRRLLSLPLSGGMLVALAAAAVFRLWLLPAGPLDGTEKAAEALRTSNAATVFLIGDGVNPQCTFYLGGADIGWVEDGNHRYERLDPRAFGVDGIRTSITAESQKGPVAVLIERDASTQNPEPGERPMLPPGFSRRLRSGRYVMHGGPNLSLYNDMKSK